MYVEHFNLKKRPFVGGSDTETFLSGPTAQNAVARIQNIMLARNGAALLTGGPGVGKSTIITQAMKPIASKVFLVETDLRQTDPSLLYQIVLLGLGGELGDGNVADSLHRLSQAARKIHQSGRQVTVAIDIIGFTIERANHILRLSHLANQTGGQLNIILMGPHALNRLLDTPGLIYLRQRIGFRYRVGPFTVAETDEYIQAEITKSRGNPSDIIADDVGTTVYQYVGGVPRLINTLMDASLSQASALGMDTLNAATIHAVATDLGWRPLSRGIPPAPSQPQPEPPAKAETGVEEMTEARVETKPKAEAKPARRKKDPAPAKAEKQDKQEDKKPEVEPDADEEIFEQPLDLVDQTGDHIVYEGTDLASATARSESDEKEDPGELTQQLLVAAENLEIALNAKKDAASAKAEEPEAEEPEPEEPEAEEPKAAKPTAAKPKAAKPKAAKPKAKEPKAEEPPANVPEMDPHDTSATGMLRLEDLDAHFAETVFGNETGMFKAIEELEKLKAADPGDES
jgi:general secretion pathway protein A